MAPLPLLLRLYMQSGHAVMSISAPMPAALSMTVALMRFDISFSLREI